MKYWLFLIIYLPAFAADGFDSLMPKRSIGEHWTVEGATPPEAWFLRDGAIGTTGQPNGFLRSKKKYRNFVLRADWRFQKGWKQKAGSDE